MNSFKHILCASVLSLIASSASASIVLNISAGQLDVGTNDARIAAGTLLQLVDLGPNGVFDPINIFDGDVGGLRQWVSGDDTVLNLNFTGTQGADAQFATTAAFDLRHSAVTESAVGRFSRVFDMTAPAGLKLGLRWFPGIQAINFASTIMQPNQTYGQFTRQSGPLNLGQVWVTPADGSNITFDALATSEIGGPDPGSGVGSGDAIYTVPEPASIALSLMGAAGLVMLRRRRS